MSATATHPVAVKIDAWPMPASALRTGSCARHCWSPHALRDVQRLYRFLAVKNMDAAKRAIKAVRQGVSVLDQQIGIGRPIDDLPVECREWMIDFGGSGYGMRYRIEADAVMILAARHQKKVDF